MNSQLTTRTRTRHFHIRLSDAAIELLIGKNRELIETYAQAYVADANEHYSLLEYCEQVSMDMKGLAAIPTIKRELRLEIRRLEKLGRGGY